MIRCVIGGDEDGRPLCSVVRRLEAGLSWRRARERCRTGRVALDGKVETDPGRRVRKGQSVEVLPARPRAPAGPRAPEVPILHVDHEVVVVDKPPGLIAEPYDEADRRDTLVGVVREALRTRARALASSYEPRLRVVHRLDKDTSGVLVFAHTREAERHLRQQFRRRTTERRYLALVQGRARPATHDSLLVRDRGDGLRGAWRRDRGPAPPSARRAVTRVEVLERLPGATLVACRLETGRQHQIRIHLSEAGTPVLGETTYACSPLDPTIRAPRTMLHAADLAFTHPATGRRMRFASPIPADFRAVLERLRAGGPAR